MPEHRAVLDFFITFTNGGDLTGRGFRLDIAGPDATEAEVSQALVGHLGLLMVDQVRIDRIEIIEEPHKGGRNVPRPVQGH